MWNRLRRMLPHAVILICNMYVVFFLIDRVNPAMNFIDNGLTKGLLLLLSAAGIFDALLLIRYPTPARRSVPARRSAPARQSAPPRYPAPRRSEEPYRAREDWRRPAPRYYDEPRRPVRGEASRYGGRDYGYRPNGGRR